jgi:molecular chaperone DnaK (HSP70)
VKTTARYLVGIDLGTTNCALAYVDLREKPRAGGPKLHTFPVPQLVAAGQVGEQPLLPSFLYLPGPHDLPPGAVALPWKPDATDVVGVFARNHGAKVPGRQVTSAKSWLCHPGVDRTSPLLPWAAPPDVPRLSPLDVSARYLKHLVEAWNYAKAAKDQADRLEEQQVVITVPASFDDVARNLTADAAKQAGLKHFTLIEEPQAAFYAWLGTHSPEEAVAVKPGMRCLVVDVGGGTSDFSLIRAGEGHGELAFLRDAVGEHLLLGGDNMDLALAKAAEAKLPAGRLDAAQFGGLIQACRQAKEALLAPKPPESYPVTVMGRGRSVVGGTISVPLTAADVRATLFDGFFPAVPFDAEPTRAARAGLQEMGLPYVADPAVTKHVAAFVRQHAASGVIDAILFNGGVFQPQALRDRVIEVMRPWFSKPRHKWEPLVLTSPSLDLAVAWGAAYFAWLKHTGGKRIGGGIPRSYYIGIETNAEFGTRNAESEAESASDQFRIPHSASRPVLCVVPRRLQEGEEISLPRPELELALGRPVLFPLFTSTVRGEDKPGDVLEVSPEQLLQLPPLHTVLRGGKRSGAKRVPVTLAAKCTEIGTLELSCVSREGNRWRLEFNVRDVVREVPREDEEVESKAVVDVWPEEKVQAAGDLIRSTFSDPQPEVTPHELPRQLEAALEAGRGEWPTGLCRRLWDFLNDVAEKRARSPAHLARWYNLTGFVLRPGFGDPLDRYRVEAAWKLVTSSASATGPKQPAVPEGGADYWIMWRRVAGGLNTAHQQNLFGRLRPALLPAKGKQYARPPANEYAEMWRAAASLERLDAKTKESLASVLLRQAKRTPVPTYAFWSLTRLGARVQLYGPLNTVVHPEVVEGWLAELIEFGPGNDSERMGWAFCLAQLARRSGLRAVDLSDEARLGVAKLLRAMSVPGAWPRMVEEVVSADGDAQSQMFGESLPIGLRLI